MSEELIILTGATGFIGQKVLSKLNQQKKHILLFSRKNLKEDQNTKCFEWHQGADIDFINLKQKIVALSKTFFKRIFLIHSSFDFVNINENYENSKLLFDQLRKFCLNENIDFKILFISSMSAYPNVDSNYGKVKLKTEQLLTNKDLIIRPGFVIGESGICGKIKKLVQKFPIIAVPYGNKTLQTIDVFSLSENICNQLANQNVGEVNLYTDTQSFIDVCKSLNPNLKRYYFSFPGGIIYYFLRFLEIIHINIGLRSDSLLSLKNLKIW